MSVIHRRTMILFQESGRQNGKPGQKGTPTNVKNTRLWFALSLLLLSIPAQAGSMAVFGPSFRNGFPLDGPGYYSLGWEFKVNYAVSATALGSWDGISGGLIQAFGTQQVGLWEETPSGPSLIASTYVSAGDPGLGGWLWHDIAPVNLSAGANYVVSSQGGATFTWSIGGFASDPSISWLGARYAELGTPANNPLVYPALSDSGAWGGFFGGNLEVGAPQVPEPCTFILVGGVALLGGLKLKRRRAFQR
jgi:hypothetical protein